VAPSGGTGVVTLTYTINGALPPGFTINPNSGVFPFTGSVTVTGAATAPGTATVTVTATDELGNRVSAAYPIPVITPPPPMVPPAGGGGGTPTGPGGSTGSTGPTNTLIDPMGNQIATVSAALTPTGPVILTVDTKGVLALTNGFSSLPLAVGIRHASVAFGPKGLVFLVTTQAGILVRFDSAGFHIISGPNIRSATLSYGPIGEVMFITSTFGETVRYDAFGARGVTNNNTRSVSLGYTPFGEVLFVTDNTGAVRQTDVTGTHTIATNFSSVSAFGGQQYLGVLLDGTLVFGVGGVNQKFGTIT
jgi:hypothetical protein